MPRCRFCLGSIFCGKIANNQHLVLRSESTDQSGKMLLQPGGSLPDRSSRQISILACDRTCKPQHNEISDHACRNSSHQSCKALYFMGETIGNRSTGCCCQTDAGERVQKRFERASQFQVIVECHAHSKVDQITGNCGTFSGKGWDHQQTCEQHHHSTNACIDDPQFETIQCKRILRTQLQKHRQRCTQ